MWSASFSAELAVGMLTPLDHRGDVLVPRLGHVSALGVKLVEEGQVLEGVVLPSPTHPLATLTFRMVGHFSRRSNRRTRRRPPGNRGPRGP